MMNDMTKRGSLICPEVVEIESEPIATRVATYQPVEDAALERGTSAGPRRSS